MVYAVLFITHRDGDWFAARNPETGDSGYLPATFVANEGSLEEEV